MQTKSLRAAFAGMVAVVAFTPSVAAQASDKATCDTEGVTCMSIAEAREGGEDRPQLRAFWAGAEEFAAVADIDLGKRFAPDYRFFFDPEMSERARCDYVALAATSHSKKHFRLNPEADPKFIYTTFLIHEAGHARQREARQIFNPYMEDVNVPEEERVTMAAFLEADARAFTIWEAYKLRDKIPGYWEEFSARTAYEKGAQVLEEAAGNSNMPDHELMASVWEDIVMVYMEDDYRLVSAMRKIQKDIYIDGEISAFDPSQPRDTLFTQQAYEAMRTLGRNVLPGEELYADDVIERITGSFSREDYLQAKAVYDHARDNQQAFCSLQPAGTQYVQNESPPGSQYIVANE